MKVSRSKTEYMCINANESSRADGVKVDELKYFWSVVHSNGECVREVKKRVQAGWVRE